MSNISIRRATVADAPAIAKIHYDALDEFHPFYAAFFKTHPKDILSSTIPAAFAKPEQSFQVAVDEASGAIVGFIRTRDVATKEPELASVDKASKDSDKEEQVSEPSPFGPKEYAKPVWERFSKKDDELDDLRDEVTKGQRFIWVLHLMIDPAHQRRGIGGKLLGAAVAHSDAQGLPTFIVASDAALALYRRHDFEALRAWEIDNGYWAGELVRRQRELGMEEDEDLVRQFEGKREVDTAMIRWPRGSRQGNS